MSKEASSKCEMHGAINYVTQEGLICSECDGLVLQIVNDNEDPFKYMRDEIDRQGELIVSILSQIRDLNHDIRRVAKEVGLDLDE